MKFRMTMMLGLVLLVGHLAGCGGGGGGDDSVGTVSDSGIDFVRPAVIATTPAHDSPEVATNRAITATFSEAIDPATINANTFVVVAASGTAVTGSVSYDEPSRTAIFRADDVPLSPQTTYTATITDAVEDLAGNPPDAPYAWQFTTGSVLDSGTTPPTVLGKLDTTPPTVMSTFPAPDEIDVAPNAAVSVTFSEPIDPVTINAQSVTLSKDGITVAGAVTFVGTTALFTPTANLSVGAVYTASVAGTIKDLAGNALAAPMVWNFTTGSQVDVTAPLALSTAPSDGALDVPIETPLVVTFNEAIKPFEFGLIDGRPVAVTFNATYEVVTMTPTAGLRPGVTYTASILVPDQAGNPMAAAHVWKFSTRP